MDAATCIRYSNRSRKQVLELMKDHYKVLQAMEQTEDGKRVFGEAIRVVDLMLESTGETYIDFMDGPLPKTQS